MSKTHLSKTSYKNGQKLYHEIFNYKGLKENNFFKNMKLFSRLG